MKCQDGSGCDDHAQVQVTTQHEEDLSQTQALCGFHFGELRAFSEDHPAAYSIFTFKPIAAGS